MLLTAVSAWQIALAVHVVCVVAAFSFLVAYPLIVIRTDRRNRRALPQLFRQRKLLSRALVNPGLLLVVIAGVYLASHGHDWSHFYVQWGIGAAVVIGGLEGSVVIRQEQRLAELASRDIDAAGAGEVEWSGDYVAVRGRADLVGRAMALLVAVTVVVMTLQ